jgi:drug/metabolite transporter (DMT)-like permease
MPLGVVFGLGSAIGWGVSNFMAGVQARKLTALSVVVTSEFVTTPLLFIVLLALGESPPLDGLAWGALAGSFGSLALAAFYQSMALGMISIAAPLSAVGAVVPVLFGLARGEVPSALEAAGIAAALAGVVLVSRPARADEREIVAMGGPPGGAGAEERPQGHDRRAVAYALLSAIGFGLFFVVTDIGTSATDGSPMWVIGGVRIGSLLALGTFALVRRDQLRWPGRRLPAIVVLGIVDTTATVLFALATAEGDIGVVSVVASLYPVGTMLLARLVLHERLGGVQRVGAALALAGVVLISAA